MGGRENARARWDRPHRRVRRGVANLQKSHVISPTHPETNWLALRLSWRRLLLLLLLEVCRCLLVAPLRGRGLLLVAPLRRLLLLITSLGLLRLLLVASLRLWVPLLVAWLSWRHSSHLFKPSPSVT